VSSQRIGGAATVHTLPDGKQISVGTEGEWAGEALMQPGLMGEGTGGDLSDAVYGAAMACQEFYARRMMLESVLLCGGGSGVQGLGKRLETELHELVPPSTKPEVVMAPDYLPASTLKHAAWCGAAVLAKVVFPQQQNITKFEYNECGPSIVHRKC
jgi:actin-related protein 7